MRIVHAHSQQQHVPSTTRNEEVSLESQVSAVPEVRAIHHDLARCKDTY